MPALVGALLPLIPGLITAIQNILKAIKDDPSTPEQAKQQLASLEARLGQTALEVAAVEFLPTSE